MKIWHKKQYFVIVMSFMILFALQTVSSARVSLQDIGMITQLTGEVTYWNENIQGKYVPAQNFMKVRLDDQFQLTPGAELQLVYFSTGRKEMWKGPVKFKLGEDTGIVLEGDEKKQKPEVSQLPATVAQEVRRISPLLDPLKLHRSGSYAVRGYKKKEPDKILKSAALDSYEKKKVEAAKEVYNSLISNSPPDDITPELYLFSIMADYDQFEEMQNIIKVMRKKQPDNTGIESLEKWIKSVNSKQ